MITFAPSTQMTAILDIWGPYYVERIQALIDGTWETTDTWGGLDSGMVDMAPYTNLPDNVVAIANQTQEDIRSGKLVIFPEATDGDLLGMTEYDEGIDAVPPT